MGGPLTTQPMEGAEFHGTYVTYTLNQFDTSVPLSQWKNVYQTSFATQADCEAARSLAMKQAADPAWRAQEALKSHNRVLDPSRLMDAIEATRCVKQ